MSDITICAAQADKHLNVVLSLGRSIPVCPKFTWCLPVQARGDPSKRSRLKPECILSGCQRRGVEHNAHLLSQSVAPAG